MTAAATSQTSSTRVEERVLGAFLRDPRLLAEHEDLHACDLLDERHRHVLAAMRAVAASGRAADVVTVGEQLESGQKRNLLEAVGGPIFLANLLGSCATTVGIEGYVDIVHDHAERRRIGDAATAIATAAYDGTDVGDLRELADKTLTRALSARKAETTRTLGEVVSATLAEVRRWHEEGVKPGLQTGLWELDELLGGLLKSDLVILGARPSMGKTAMAMGIAIDAAEGGARVAVFSLEMASEQLGLRVLCGRAQVEQLRLRRAHGTSDELYRIGIAAGALGKLDMHLDDRGSASLTHIRSVSRRLAREKPLDLVVVDYLQLMRAPGTSSREREVAEISMGLKALAKDLDVPVLALAQLNRSLEKRPDKRPVLSDLRDSGQMEQDADVVAFLYRDEFYDPESDAAGQAEVIVAKQRNGRTGTVSLQFIAEHTTFASLRAEPAPTQETIDF